MKPRFLILIVIAIGLAVYFAGKKNSSKTHDDEASTFVSDDPNARPNEAEGDGMLYQQSLPGDEPKEKPKFDVRVEVDTSGKKSRLYLFVSEQHGYYVETLEITVWRKGPNVTGPEDAAVAPHIYKNLYIKANETLRTCMELSPVEVGRAGGNLGTASDWDAIVTRYGRAREKNPDPLPYTPGDMHLCD